MKDLLIHKTREKIAILNWNHEIKESILLEQFDHVILIECGVYPVKAMDKHFQFLWSLGLWGLILF